MNRFRFGEIRVIYFDNNATTPLSPSVREAMLPFLGEAFGNPNSVHEAGTRTRAAIERARTKVANGLGVTASEITFTGSGSEANNHAVIGALLAQEASGKNLVVSSIEHPSVGVTAAWAAKRFGFELRVAPFRVESDRVDPSPFLERIDTDTVLVSVMAANNETGVLMPLEPIFQAAKKVGALCHTDAVQGFGKIDLRPVEWGVDLLGISGHKFHGPKGAGALFIRRGVKIEPLIHGGPQESARRAGTENVANIVGLGVAAEEAAVADKTTIRALRDYFESRLADGWAGSASVNFQKLLRTPNASSVLFAGQDANLLMIKLDRKGVCISTGAACSSGSLTASKTLLAMGLKETQATATLRFSFSKYNTKSEVDEALDRLAQILPPN